MALPILALLGNNVLWIITTSLGATLIAIWIALKTSWSRGAVCEELELWIDQIHLRRINPDGSCQIWQANPYWVDVAMQETDGPVLNYLTLRGGGRTVEIGSFLSEQERPKLAQGLRDALLIAVKNS